jgi:SAM-dependent methyltransferase/Flp pilus assembly protein TadD
VNKHVNKPGWRVGDAAGSARDLAEAAGLADSGQFLTAEMKCRRILSGDPDHVGALHLLGRIALQRGSPEVAFDLLHRAAGNKRRDLELQCDLARSLQLLNRTQEAIECLSRVTARWPAALGAAKQLADIMLEQRRPAAAADIYRRLLTHHPASARVRVALVDALKAAGELDAAAHFMLEAFKLDPQNVRYFHFVAFTLYALRPALKRATDHAMQVWPSRLTLGDISQHVSLSALAKDELLLWILEARPAADLRLERLLTGLRAALVAAAEQDPHADTGDKLRVCCAIARQAFNNEYIFATQPAEEATAKRLRDRLEAALAAEAPVDPLVLAASAMYFPLTTLAHATALVRAELPQPLAEVVRQQIVEPREEETDRCRIPQLTPIVDPASIEVRRQYEQSPYPRWVHPASRGTPMTLRAHLGGLPNVRADVFPEDRDLDVLVAGCGTGQSTVDWAQMVTGARFTAIDLSLSSLAHARRKTREHGIRGVDYFQGDIMALGTLGRSFDMVESCGVLHHLADPLEGWRILLSLLRPRGVMKVALYSELARRDIAAARTDIVERGYTATPQDIRRYRQELGDTKLRQLSPLADFYSLSECRDLLFHVVEHNFTIPNIAAFLDEQDVKFLGFDLPGPLMNAYRHRFPDDPSANRLDRWHRYEMENPDTFVSMYVFWIQKR